VLNNDCDEVVEAGTPTCEGRSKGPVTLSWHTRCSVIPAPRHGWRWITPGQWLDYQWSQKRRL